MTERDVECVVQRAREVHPGAAARVVSDNAPQFIARDFKEFIRVTGTSHVRTSRNDPQSNGKIERYHTTLRGDTIRVTPPSSLAEARAVVLRFVEHSNSRRLHNAIGYVAPQRRPRRPPGRHPRRPRPKARGCPRAPRPASTASRLALRVTQPRGAASQPA
jgi:transposase InsO family protein